MTLEELIQKRDEAHRELQIACALAARQYASIRSVAPGIAIHLGRN